MDFDELFWGSGWAKYQLDLSGNLDHISYRLDSQEIGKNKASQSLV